MKLVKNVLLVLFTLALVAVGAAMPFAASRLQDARQAGVEVRSFDSFLLTLRKKGELSQILRFLAESQFYEFIENDPEKAILSEAEAREAAIEAVTLMFKSGIISKEVMAVIESNEAAGVDRPDVEMARMVPETDPQTASFVVWGVDWYNLGIQIWLDDASGKAFQIYYSYVPWYNDQPYDGGNASSTRMTKEQFYARMDDWRMFLEDYYEVSIQNIEEIPYSYSQGFLIYIELEDGGDWIPMRLWLYEDSASLSVAYIEPAPDEP